MKFNMELELTREMNKALDIVCNTKEHVFITGKAGTGKTTLLKYLMEHTNKKCVVAAPTGISAINAGGVTLFSLLNIPFGPIPPTGKIEEIRMKKEKIDLLRDLDTLIIDEISMVRSDLLDYVDKKLQIIRRSSLAFGGMQLVMFGDLFQLPPVVKSEDKAILDAFYTNTYIFNSWVFKYQSFFNVIELTHIFRQSDPNFISILNSIREYNVSRDQLEILDEARDRKISQDFDNEYVHICTYKRDVEAINSEKLGVPTDVFKANVTGDFPKNAAPCDLVLSIRKGAKVMTLVNDPAKQYSNGTLGVIMEIKPSEILLKLDNGKLVNVSRCKWSNFKYSSVRGEITKEEIGSCVQFPVTLAWAITIHKSQGLTFNKVSLHMSHAFCPGQLYVALSRCRSLEGIVSDSFIKKDMIIPDQPLLDFEEKYKKANNKYGKIEETLAL